MAYLEINGWGIDAAYKSVGHTSEIIGYQGRSFGMGMRDHKRGDKEVFQVTTPPMSEANGVALEALLKGSGHHWNFESDLYSIYKGLGPNTGYGATISATQQMYGARAMYLASGNSVVFDPDYNSDCSISVWHYESAWAHLVLTYDADTTTTTKYENNASGDFVCVALSAGAVTLHGKDRDAPGTGAKVYYDDLVIVPYVMTAAQNTAIYAAGSGLEFSDLPRLDIGGDLLKTTGTKEFAAFDVSYKQMGVYLSSAWTDTARSYSFKLVEC